MDLRNVFQMTATTAISKRQYIICCIFVKDDISANAGRRTMGRNTHRTSRLDVGVNLIYSASNSDRMSAAPAASALSLPRATSRASGTIPQLVQG
jgi:hypothetical protein